MHFLYYAKSLDHMSSLIEERYVCKIYKAICQIYSKEDCCLTSYYEDVE